MNAFDLLDERIRIILKENGLISPTEIQQKSIPIILERKNALLIAPTGLGKTEAAILPVFSNFLKERKKKEKSEGISIIYITPLRALNRDMLRRTFSIGKALGISISVRHGDTSQYQRTLQTKNPPDMLITTPETFQILFTGKRLKNHLRTVRWVIIDEIHELAGEERGAQLAVGLERLEEITLPYSFQRIGISATVGSPEEVARYLGGFKNGMQREVEIVEVDVSKNIDIDVELVGCSNNKKAAENVEPNLFASLKRCKELIEKHRATLLFVNTRDTAEILGSRFLMWDKDFAIDVHHGSLSKSSRVEAEENFKNGKLKALICTSSLELGIDIGHADFVIQYSSPRQVTRILQRVGRSGHKVGETSRGKIITLSPEDFMESIVIANRSLSKKLEKIEVRKNPYSVLANQIISMALEYKSIEAKRVYEIVRRAYPFSTLSWKSFLKVLHEIAHGSRRVIVKGDKIKASTKSRLYFIENISMIPDERNYVVVDITNRKKIGILDENFVLTNAYEGATFILHGRPWKVVKLEGDSILVSPIMEIGRIPSWIGEDIPVPFEVAQEVGLIRRKVGEGIEKLDYPCSEESLKAAVEYIRNAEGFAIPCDNRITIEVSKKLAIINACFGTKVNETLGRILSSLLAQRFGESVKMGSDPYRIILEFSHSTSAHDIEDVLLSIEPESVEHLLKIILKNSTFLRYYLIHTARKFGAISENFDYSSVGTKRLLELFDSTMIMEETLQKIIWDKMDVINTKEVLKKIRRGDIEIVKQGLSPFSKNFDISRGLMLPQRPESVIIEAISNRLEEREVLLLCLNCFHKWKTKVKRADIKPKCSKCGAFRIAVVKEDDLIALKDMDERKIRNLSTTASLVLSYGKFALITLAGRGIGAKTAARILKKYRFYELKNMEEKRRELIRDIWKAEIQYAQTRGFWER